MLAVYITDMHILTLNWSMQLHGSFGDLCSCEAAEKRNSIVLIERNKFTIPSKLGITAPKRGLAATDQSLVAAYDFLDFVPSQIKQGLEKTQF